MPNSLINRFKYISNFEVSNEVEALQKQGLDYWPILKLLLFTFDRKPLRKGIFKGFRILLSDFKSFIYRFKPNPFRQYLGESLDVLFFSANSYRENILGKSHNKFFHEALQYFLIRGFKVLEIDYSYPSSNLQYENYKSLIFVNRVPQQYSVKYDIQYSEFEYSMFGKFAGILNVELSLFLAILTSEICSVISWKNYYLDILGNFKPKYIVISCYYSIPMFGLIAAAHELGILTFDFQHGGQGEAHPCYYYDRSVTKKLNTLPNHFGVWDNKSYNLINNWAKDFHSVFLLENSWHSIVKRNFPLINFKEKFILFTLTLGRSNMLPSYIIEAVRNTDEIWYFRFHPRTSDVDKLWVVKAIESLKFTNVKFDLANSVPLPLLLLNCDTLVSQSSGSVSEAISLNVSNIIVTDELGHNFYKDEIDSNIVVKFEANKQLLSELLFINRKKLKESLDSINLIDHINSILLSLE